MSRETVDEKKLEAWLSVKTQFDVYFAEAFPASILDIATISLRISPAFRPDVPPSSPA
jgi:hypothetical protein